MCYAVARSSLDVTRVTGHHSSLTTHHPLPTALCPLPSALCPLPSALCPLPSALCPLPTAHCPLPLTGGGHGARGTRPQEDGQDHDHQDALRAAELLPGPLDDPPPSDTIRKCSHNFPSARVLRGVGRRALFLFWRDTARLLHFYILVLECLVQFASDGA